MGGGKRERDERGERRDGGSGRLTHFESFLSVYAIRRIVHFKLGAEFLFACKWDKITCWRRRRSRYIVPSFAASHANATYFAFHGVFALLFLDLRELKEKRIKNPTARRPRLRKMGDAYVHVLLSTKTHDFRISPWGEMFRK